MKQVIQNFKTGELSVEDVPLPKIRPDGVLVKNHYSLVSVGTEKSVIEFAKQSLAGKAKKRPDLLKEVLNKLKTDGIWSTYQTVHHRLDTPIPLGYSCAGKVIEVGERAADFSKDDHVACGGAGYASHSEVVYVPKNLCVKIPNNVTTKEASFVTLGSIAMQGIRIAHLTQGERIAVIGLGLIGQLTVQILSAYGFPVFGLDVKRSQLEKATQIGLQSGAVIGEDDVERGVDNFTEGNGVDAVIITASTSSNEPIEIAGRTCRDKGRISVVGEISLNIPRNLYFKKELEITVSRSYGPGRYDSLYEEKGLDYPIGYVRWTENRNMKEFLRLINTGRVDVSKMVSHVFKIEEAEKAYELILKNPLKEEITGVLLEYDTAKDHPSVILKDSTEKKRGQKEVLNAGIIGAGNFSRSTILPNLAKVKELSLKAIADIQGERAKRASDKYRCQYITSDYMDILNDDDIDMVIIATRHDLHSKIASLALKMDKHVYIEKPLALNLKQLKEVYQSEQASRGVLFVGYNRRFSSLAQQAKRKLETRGTPLMMFYRINAGSLPKDNWVHDSEQGGGRIIGEICHFVDFFLFITGAAPERVYTSEISAAGSIIESDNVSIVLDFSDGSRGSILYTSLGSKAVSKEYIEIFSDENVVLIDNFKSGKFYKKNKLKRRGLIKQDKGHLNELVTFARAVKNGEPPPISVKDLLVTTLTTFKIVESLQKKVPLEISLSEILPE